MKTVIVSFLICICQVLASAHTSFEDSGDSRGYFGIERELTELAQNGDTDRAIRLSEVLFGLLKECSGKPAGSFSTRRNFISDTLRWLSLFPQAARNLVSDPTPPPPTKFYPEWYQHQVSYLRRGMEPEITVDNRFGPAGTDSSPSSYRKGFLQALAQNSLDNIKGGIVRVADILDYKPNRAVPPQTIILTQPSYY